MTRNGSWLHAAGTYARRKLGSVRGSPAPLTVRTICNARWGISSSQGENLEHRRIAASLMSVLLAVGLVPSIGLSEPVYFAGTGHFYEAVSSDVGYGRSSAVYHAGDAGGYLATITSSEENDFVASLLTPGEEYWLGGAQYPGGIEPDGGWHWDGHWGIEEPWGYTNWTGGAPTNPQWLSVIHQAGSPNPNLAGWITGGDGLGGASEFSIVFGDEPAIGPVVFQAGTEYSQCEVATIINDLSRATRGYDCACIAYDSYLNLYYLRIVAKDPSMGEVLVQTDQGGMLDADFARGFLEGNHLTICGSTGLWEEKNESFFGRGIGFVVEYPVPEPGVVSLLVCAGSAGAIHGLGRRRPV